MIETLYYNRLRSVSVNSSGVYMFFFFFSSRRRHTRFDCDWSSDVCSSDLNPMTVEVARRNTPAELVAQVVYPVQADQKRHLLAHLVRSNDWRQVLVFVRTKHGANRLSPHLRR